MYRLISENIRTSENETVLFGIADETGVICTFAENAEDAERFAVLCNENAVERNQVADVIEDLFYS